MGKFVESNFVHYEFLGDHFSTVKGYDSYAQKAAIAREGGLEGATEGSSAVDSESPGAGASALSRLSWSSG